MSNELENKLSFLGCCFLNNQIHSSSHLLLQGLLLVLMLLLQLAGRTNSPYLKSCMFRQCFGDLFSPELLLYCTL